MKYGTPIKGFVLGAAAVLASVSGASAALLVTFNPTAAGLGAGIVPFQSDTANGLDTARAVINNSTGAFTEVGVLRYDVFDNGINPLTQAATGLGTQYSLYLAFSAAGTLPGFNAASPSGATGTFSSITYTLFGDPGRNDTLTGASAGVNPSVNGIAPPGVPAGDILLASGGTIAASAVGISTLGIPTASVILQMTPTGTGFFQSPAGINQFQATFSNSPGTFLINNLGATTEVVISQGAFNSNLNVVAEPAPLAMLGVGLLGLAGVVRLRQQKA